MDPSSTLTSDVEVDGSAEPLWHPDAIAAASPRNVVDSTQPFTSDLSYPSYLTSTMPVRDNLRVRAMFPPQASPTDATRPINEQLNKLYSSTSYDESIDDDDDDDDDDHDLNVHDDMDQSTFHFDYLDEDEEEDDDQVFTIATDYWAKVQAWPALKTYFLKPMAIYIAFGAGQFLSTFIVKAIQQNCQTAIKEDALANTTNTTTTQSSSNTTHQAIWGIGKYSWIWLAVQLPFLLYNPKATKPQLKVDTTTPSDSTTIITTTPV